MTIFAFVRSSLTALFLLLQVAIWWTSPCSADDKVSGEQIARLAATNARVRQILQVKQDFQRRYPGLRDLFESLANRVVVAEFFPNNLRQIPMMVTVVGGSAIGKSVAIAEFYRTINVPTNLRQISEGQMEVPVDAITEFAKPGLVPAAGSSSVVIFDDGHNMQTAAGRQFKHSLKTHQLPIYNSITDTDDMEDSLKFVQEGINAIDDRSLRSALLQRVEVAASQTLSRNRQSQARSALDILWSLWGMGVFQVESSNNNTAAGLEKIRETLVEKLNLIEARVASSPMQPADIISQVIVEMQNLAAGYRDLVSLFIKYQPNISPAKLTKYLQDIEKDLEYLTKHQQNWWTIYPNLATPILYRTLELGTIEHDHALRLTAFDPNMPARIAKKTYFADKFDETQQPQLVAILKRIFDAAERIQALPSTKGIGDQIEILNKEIKEIDKSELITEVNSTPSLFGELKILATAANFRRTPGHYFLKLLDEDPIQLARILERVYTAGLKPYNAFGVTVIILANDLALQNELRAEEYPTADARRAAAARKLRDYPIRRRVLDILYGMFGAPHNPEAFESRAGEFFYYAPTSNEEWLAKIDALVNEKLREIEKEAGKQNLTVNVQLSSAVTTRLTEILVGSNTTTRSVLGRLTLLATPSYELVEQLKREQSTGARFIHLELSNDGEELQFREKNRTLVSFAVSHFKDPSEGGVTQNSNANTTSRRRLVWAASKTVVGALFTSSVPTFQQVSEESTRLDRWWNIPNQRTLEYNLTRASLLLVTCASEITYLGGQDLSSECQKDRALARHYMETAIDILKERTKVATGQTTPIQIARLNLPAHLQSIAKLAGMELGDAKASVDRLAELMHFLVLVCDPVTKKLLAHFESNGVGISAKDLSKIMQTHLPKRMVSDLGNGYWHALSTNRPGVVADIQQTPFGQYSGFQSARPNVFIRLISGLVRYFSGPSRAETSARANMNLSNVNFSQCRQFLENGPAILRNNPLDRRN